VTVLLLQLEPGTPVTWKRVHRGGYGFAIPVPAVVVAVVDGGKGVMIDAELERGGTKRIVVKRKNLVLRKGDSNGQ
jgi:hypothetical protein